MFTNNTFYCFSIVVNFENMQSIVSLSLGQYIYLDNTIKIQWNVLSNITMFGILLYSHCFCIVIFIWESKHSSLLRLLREMETTPHLTFDFALWFLHNRKRKTSVHISHALRLHLPFQNTLSSLSRKRFLKGQMKSKRRAKQTSKLPFVFRLCKNQSRSRPKI